MFPLPPTFAQIHKITESKSSISCCTTHGLVSPFWRDRNCIPWDLGAHSSTFGVKTINQPESAELGYRQHRVDLLVHRRKEFRVLEHLPHFEARLEREAVKSVADSGSRVEGRGSSVEGRGSRVEGRGSRVEG